MKISTMLYEKSCVDEASLALALKIARENVLEEVVTWADSRIEPQKHGQDCLGEFCDGAFCNWDVIYQTNKEMELLKAHLDELIKATK